MLRLFSKTHTPHPHVGREFLYYSAEYILFAIMYFSMTEMVANMDTKNLHFSTFWYSSVRFMQWLKIVGRGKPWLSTAY